MQMYYFSSSIRTNFFCCLTFGRISSTAMTGPVHLSHGCSRTTISSMVLAKLGLCSLSTTLNLGHNSLGKLWLTRTRRQLLVIHIHLTFHFIWSIVYNICNVWTFRENGILVLFTMILFGKRIDISLVEDELKQVDKLLFSKDGCKV